MKNSKRFAWTILAALFSVSILSLTGCGRTDVVSGQADTAVQYEIPEVQTVPDTAQKQDVQDAAQEQKAETGIIIRAYSDREKERMNDLQQSYQNETIYPENLISEVDNAEEITEGTLCYIRSTGEYYLPDRESAIRLSNIDFRFHVLYNSYKQ